ANENDGESEAAEADGGEGEGEGDDDSPPQSGGMSAPGSGGMSGERQGEGEPGTPADLVSLVESGDQAALQMALAEGARQAQLNRIRLFTQRGMFTRRIMEIMGLDGLNEEVDRREATGNLQGAESLRTAREELR